ncbi:MAG: sigma 54-interacting transcriptional regulator [Acidobacteriia bacterium]|nr:sigma 54-interacting transcriptional regulator [Terriglobia bacterium]
MHERRSGFAKPEIPRFPADGLLENLLQRLRAAVGAETADVLFLSCESGHFESGIFDGLPDNCGSALRLPAGDDLAVRIAAAEGPMIIEDAPDDIRQSPTLKGRQKFLAGASLRSGNRVIWMLLLGATQHRHFNESDLLMVELAADRIAATLESASVRECCSQAQDLLADERKRLEMLLGINNSLVSKLNIRELFAAISESLRRVTRHNYSQIVLLDRKCNQLKVAAVDFPNGKGLIREGLVVPHQGSPAGFVFTSRKPLLIRRLQRDEFPSGITDCLLSEGVRSICLAPLVRHERMLGVLSIGSAQEDGFTQEDLGVMNQVAGQVAIAIENALAFEQIEELNRRLSKEKQFLEEELRAEGLSNEIVGASQALTDVLNQVQTVAGTNATVLVIGETGTGKELIARAVHQLSGRRDGPFIKLNCAAIPAALLESELFGHAKGAFTGAVRQQLGRLELADGGTLFLDEIGELPLELQPKLLRVLQDRKFERLGEARTVSINVRLVAATNRNLTQMVQRGEFRSDLYYRLNVFPVLMPPLRERKEDIPPLVRYFAEKFSRQMQKHVPVIAPAAMNTLITWHWPGNIRELENVVERAVILSSGPVLELASLQGSGISERGREGPGTLEHAEREHILRVIKESSGVIGTPLGAAARLDLKRTTLYAKMKKLGISREHGLNRQSMA